MSQTRTRAHGAQNLRPYSVYEAVYRWGGDALITRRPRPFGKGRVCCAGRPSRRRGGRPRAHPSGWESPRTAASLPGQYSTVSSRATVPTGPPGASAATGDDDIGCLPAPATQRACVWRGGARSRRGRRDEDISQLVPDGRVIASVTSPPPRPAVCPSAASRRRGSRPGARPGNSVQARDARVPRLTAAASHAFVAAGGLRSARTSRGCGAAT